MATSSSSRQQQKQQQMTSAAKRPLSRHLSPIFQRRLLYQASGASLGTSTPINAQSPAVNRKGIPASIPTNRQYNIRNSYIETQSGIINLSDLGTLTDDAPELPHRPMTKAKKTVLRMNSLMLKNDIDFDDCLILDYLYQQKTLTHDNYETIKRLKCQSRADQVHKFLKILERKGNAGFDTFLEALRIEGCYEYIFLKLATDLAKELELEDQATELWHESSVYRTPSITRCDEADTPLYVPDENPTYIVKRPTYAPIVMEQSRDEVEYKLNDLYTILTTDDDYELLPPSFNDSLRHQQGSAATNATNLRDQIFTVPELIQEFLDDEKELSVGTQLIMCFQLSELVWEITKDNSHSLMYDSHGNLLLVNMNAIKRSGNAIGEKWYYPTKVSSHQIGLWLSETKVKGCFYVYTSTNSEREGKVYAPFNLSLCHTDSGEVTHYRIEANANNELIIGDVKDANRMKFQNIHILVEYFKLNRGCLPCRLRWSPNQLERQNSFEATIQEQELDIHYNDELTGNNNNNTDLTHSSYVYKGRYSGRDVAVKLPSKKSALRRIEEDDFLTEARILRKINHEHIRRLEGVCYVNNTVHLVLEYAAKSNLKQCLEEGAINNDPVIGLRIWVQILHALDYLAKQNYIIHRDVAARNCLVQDMDSLQVQLSDFGMAAKVIQYDQYLSDVEETFAVRWAAPEVLKECLFSTKSDIWAAGVLFWEIASGGMLPYTKVQHCKVPEKVLSGKACLKYEEAMDAGYKTLIKDILSSCFHRDTEERPTAEHLIVTCNRHIDAMVGTDTIYDNGKSFGVAPEMRKNSKGRRSLRDSFKGFFSKKK